MTTTRNTIWKPTAATALLLAAPAGVAVLLLALTGAITPPPGLELLDPGALTRWGLPATRALRDMAAIATIGLLVATATLLPGRREQPRLLSIPQLRLVTASSVTGAAWFAAGLAELVLAYSDVAGERPLASGLPGLVFFVENLELGQALLSSLVLVALVAFWALVIRTVTSAGLLVVLALAALWPLALTGHAAGSTDHDYGVNLQFLHLVAGAVWVGTLLALVLAKRYVGAEFPTVVRRYSTIALWCFLAMTFSGVLAASIRIPGLTDLDPSALNSDYGRVLGLKVTALATLGAAGWYHRRRLLDRLDQESSTRWFLRLAAAELAVMAAAVGAGVALSRTPPPSRPDRRITTAEDLLGYPMPQPLGLTEWFSQWRIDTFWAPLAVVAALMYVGGVRRLARRGDSWSWSRTSAWIIGCVGLLWATSGSPGVYGDVLFSMHMVQHMTLATAVPIFFVLGAPVTLALRSLNRRDDGSRGPREWLLKLVHSIPLRLLSHPLVAAGLFIVGLVAFYNSELFELSLRTHTAHLLMTAHFLMSGYLFANVICGIDPGPRRPIYPFRVLLVMVTFGFHAFFSISLMSSKTLLAEDWYGSLGRTWGATLARDQYLGASIGWALGDYPLAIMAAAVVWGWVKDDRREARRLDRQADRDNDKALADYNDYLQALSKRPGRTER